VCFEHALPVAVTTCPFPVTSEGGEVPPWQVKVYPLTFEDRPKGTLRHGYLRVGQPLPSTSAEGCQFLVDQLRQSDRALQIVLALDRTCTE